MSSKNELQCKLNAWNAKRYSDCQTFFLWKETIRQIKQHSSQQCHYEKNRRKETPTQVFPFEYCEIFKKQLSLEQLWWLLLRFERKRFSERWIFALLSIYISRWIKILFPITLFFFFFLYSQVRHIDMCLLIVSF